MGLFEISADTGNLAARIAKRACTALKAEAALVGFFFFGNVGVARNINAAAGSPAKNRLILKPCHDSCDPRTADMIHQIAPDLIRTVCQSRRKTFRLRLQQDHCGSDRRCVEENHPGTVGACFIGFSVYNPNAADPVVRWVIVQALDDSIMHHGQIAGTFGSRQGRIEGRKVRLEAAAVMTTIAGLTIASAQRALFFGGVCQVGNSRRYHIPAIECCFHLLLE